MHSAAELEKIVLDLAVIIGASVAVLLISHRIRLSPVVGLILTGLLLGPSGLGVTDQKEVELLAEVGVVLLLFTVGLEVSLVRLKRSWRPFLVGGGLQVLATIAVTAAIAVGAGLGYGAALFLGFLGALSSTAIVLKTYSERRELTSPQGMICTAILLFQDFAVAPMILLVPVLAGAAATSAGGVALRLGAGLVAVALAFAAARTVVPRLLEGIVGTRTREAFVLGVLALCMVMALFTSRLGFSLGLGAFLAGLVLSESRYSHQVVAEVLPIRDVFNSLFFVSVGMLLNLSFAAENAGVILAIGAGIFVFKSGIVALVTTLLSYPARIAWIAGFSLAQIGEFSFVVAGVGHAYGLLADEPFQIFLGVSIVTMIATPFVVRAAPAIASRGAFARLGRRGVGGGAGDLESEAEMAGHVIVVGYGLIGGNLSRALGEAGIAYVVVELDGAVVREGRRRGHPLVFGDATRLEVLHGLGVERAAVLVVVIADAAATRQIVRVARQANPSLHILVRTVDVEEVDALLSHGADEVIPEEFETSVEIFSRVLGRFHVPRNLIRAQQRIVRSEGYELLRGRAPEGPWRERLGEILAGSLTETFLLREDAAVAGRTLAELDLRRRSGGATVIAVVRDGEPMTNPSPDLRLERHDVLVMVGDHASLDRASKLLEESAAG